MRVTPRKLTASNGRKIFLTAGRSYEVLGIEANDYRVLTDEDQQPCGNDPVLYAAELFEIVDPGEPEFWQCEYGEDGERYCYPPEWATPGFFEDFHDGVGDALNAFRNGLKKYYPETWNERKGCEKSVWVKAE